MIVHLIWSSMIDYPGHTSAVLFTNCCNFDCSYCYNKTLKDQKEIDFNNTILPRLLERKEFIDHIIISGGEPTCDPDFDYILKTLKDKGFIIGVHTNGSNPDKIMSNAKYIDYIGLDIKTSFLKYNLSAGTDVKTKEIIKTIKFILNSNIKYEFRTTLFPKHVKKEDVLEIAKWLKEIGAKEYHLQQYYAVNTAEKIDPYLQNEIEEIAKESNKIIKTVLKTK